MMMEERKTSEESIDSHVLLISKDGIVGLELVLGEKILSLGDLDVELQKKATTRKEKCQLEAKRGGRSGPEQEGREKKDERGGFPCRRE